MHYNQNMYDLDLNLNGGQLLKKIIESSKSADGNPEDPCLIDSITEFKNKFNSREKTTLAILRYAILLKLTKYDIIWLYKSLPVFMSHEYITEKQCNVISAFLNGMLSE